MKMIKKNESEYYDVATYIGLLSFLWNVPCRLVRILVGGILFGDTLPNFSDFDWEDCYGVDSTHSPRFGFIIPYWQSRLEIVYPVYFPVLGLVKIRKALSRKRGIISKWELVRIFVSCVGLSYVYRVHYKSNAHDFIVTRISIAVW